MPELASTWPLVVQAMLAAFAVRELARHVFPAVPRMHHPELVTDVWAPLAIAAPMLFMAGRVQGSVRGAGWMGLGAPVVGGWVALAAVLIVHRHLRAGDGPGRRELAAIAVTGLLLLLLGAAHVMTIWVGQCAFAVAAVLLWINTPDPSSAVSGRSDAPPRAGLAMLAALAAALGQGALAWRAEPPLDAVSAGLVMGYVTIALCVASVAGPGRALRVGVWTAVFGVLIGLGVLSFTVVVPAAVAALGSAGRPVVTVVAEGFGAYAPEALGLVVLAVALPLSWRVPPGPRRIGAALVLVLLAALTALRVAGM